MRREMIGILGLGIALSSTGCWRARYQQKMAAFEQRVAERCVDAAQGSRKAPAVHVVPAAPDAASPSAPGTATTVIIVPQ